MSMLNIEKPVSSPLELMYAEDSDSTLVVHVTPITYTVHGMYITFSGSSLTATEKLNRTRTMGEGCDHRNP